MSGTLRSFDLDELKNIPIENVILNFGGRTSKSKTSMHCPNGAAHKSGEDKHPSLGIDKNKNICKCFVCGLQGDPINVARTLKGDNFKEGCVHLHEAFGIPYANGANLTGTGNGYVKQEPKQVEWVRFNKNKKYQKIEKVEKFIPKYEELNESQRLKIVYTLFYKASLKTNQESKEKYYLSRDIDLNKKERYLKMIGYLGPKEVREVVKQLKELFPLEDLKKFNVLNNKGYFKYDDRVGFTVVPSFDLYTNMVTGMMLRYTDGRKKYKEMALCKFSIVAPIPFGVGYKAFSNCRTIWFTEGHIDALSFEDNVCFAAFGGTQSYQKEMLGLFKGKEVILAFDKDKPGSDGIEIIKPLLEDAGAVVRVAYWNAKYGKDINDLRKKGHLDKVTYIN